MQANEFTQTLAEAKAVPVIRHDNPDIALTGARLLSETGFVILEITFTVPDAARIIGELNESLPDAIIGAGTVLTAAQAKAALGAGAKFLVSPCWSADAAEKCADANIPYLPGAATPGEILHHWQAGAAVVKIFPAREAGGPGFLKAVRAVFADIPLMPTGGVKPEHLPDYLAAGALCAGLGSELFPVRSLEKDDHARARETIIAARELMGLPVIGSDA